MAYDQKNYAESANTAYGSQLGYAASVAPPVPETFMSPLMRADGSLDELMAIAQRLTDRFVGSVPTDPNKAALGAVSNGMFDDLAHLGRRMQDKTANIRDMLSRIEGQLP